MWVGINNPRFRYARNGYIPALELPEQPIPQPPDPAETYEALTSRMDRMMSSLTVAINRVNYLYDRKKKGGEEPF